MDEFKYKEILVGICGSRAYGLDTPTSDTDLRGIYVVPTKDILGVYPYPETIDKHEPDVCLHELRKFFKLAIGSNPNILELMYLSEYTTLSVEGEMIIENRKAFLSNKIKATYGGYAMSQIHRLRNRADEGDASFGSNLRNRYAKHARHCFRLIAQGQQLLETGELTVKVDNREELFWLGEQEPAILEQHFGKAMDEFNLAESILPNEPDLDCINTILLEIRKLNP